MKKKVEDPKVGLSDYMSSNNNVLSQRPTTAATHVNHPSRPISINTQPLQYPDMPEVLPKSNSEIMMPTERTK